MPKHTDRIRNHEILSDKISRMTETEVAELLSSGKPVGSSMGAYAIEIDGILVFAKQIAVSDFELAQSGADGKLSTANIFNLPTCYQYAFNSAGFGAGRELASHEKTTNWVLSGECESFPLTYGYKMVDRAPSSAEDLPSEDQRAEFRKYWNGSKEIEDRMDALKGATKAVVVFMESIPQTLSSYIHPKEGDERRPNMAKVENGIIATTDFMQSQGVMHCNAHDGNILVDDEGQIYFADFGMVLSKDFALSTDERRFLEENQNYDRSQALSSLCRHPKDKVTKVELPILPEVKEVSDRYKSMAARFKEFSDNFKADDSKSVVYPKEEMDKLYHEAHVPSYSQSTEYSESLATKADQEWSKKFPSKKSAEAEDLIPPKKSWKDVLEATSKSRDDSTIVGKSR